MGVSVLMLATAVALSAAHVCLIFPHQRGSMQELNKPGSNDCIRLDSECGKMPMETPQVSFKAGGNVSIVFQKNLNHWDNSTPGSFDVAIGDVSEKDFKPVFSIPDTNTKSLTLYTPNITIPMEPMDRAVMQVRYVTKNPDAPAIFYQCADITINK